MASKTIVIMDNSSSCTGMTLSHRHLWDIDSEIEPKIVAALPSNAKITSVVLRVMTYHTWTNILGGNAKIYLTAWFGDVGDAVWNYGTNLIPETKITNDKTWATYTSDNLVEHFTTTYPFSINTAYPAFYIYYDTANMIERTYYHQVALVIEYEEHTHSYSSTVTKQPTCTTTGVRTYTCSCGHSYTETISATGHNSNTTIPAVAATCTTTGLTEGKKCSACGTMTVAQQTVAALGHTWVAATCTKPKTCSVCEATEGSALGHNYTSQVIAPTAAVDGYTLHTCQNGCGSSYKDNYRINKIFIGTTQPSKLYIDIKEVKEIYVGTTKVYG